MNNFVAKGLKKCPLCQKEHDRNMEILINKRLRNIKDQVTGLDLCKDCYEEDYYILIEANPHEDMEGRGVQLTGQMAKVRRNSSIGELVAKQIDTDWAFITTEDFNALKEVIDA